MIRRLHRHTLKERTDPMIYVILRCSTFPLIEGSAIILPYPFGRICNPNERVVVPLFLWLVFLFLITITKIWNINHSAKLFKGKNIKCAPYPGSGVLELCSLSCVPLVASQSSWSGKAKNRPPDLWEWDESCAHALLHALWMPLRASPWNVGIIFTGVAILLLPFDSRCKIKNFIRIFKENANIWTFQKEFGIKSEKKWAKMKWICHFFHTFVPANSRHADSPPWGRSGSWREQLHIEKCLLTLWLCPFEPEKFQTPIDYQRIT